MPPFTWVWTVSMQWLTESYRWVWKVQLLSTSATSGCKLYKVIPRVGEWHAISKVVLSSANHLDINLSNLIQSQLNIDIFCVSTGNGQCERQKGGDRTPHRGDFPQRGSLTQLPLRAVLCVYPGSHQELLRQHSSSYPALIFFRKNIGGGQG